MAVVLEWVARASPLRPSASATSAVDSAGAQPATAARLTPAIVAAAAPHAAVRWARRISMACTSCTSTAAAWPAVTLNARAGAMRANAANSSGRTRAIVISATWWPSSRSP